MQRNQFFIPLLKFDRGWASVDLEASIEIFAMPTEQKLPHNSHSLGRTESYAEKSRKILNDFILMQ